MSARQSVTYRHAFSCVACGVFNNPPEPRDRCGACGESQTAPAATMARTRRRQPRQTERAEQEGIVQLLRAIGATVYVSGTTRQRTDTHHGTCQTPGIPDIEAFLPARFESRVLLKVEVKAAGGRLRPEQAVYRDLCAVANVPHIVGGLDAVIAWLSAHGYLRTDQVSHAHLANERK